jgi:hypothetical protein
MLCCSTKSPLHGRCSWVSSTPCAPKLTTRTPPELKWLLVERATLLGDISQLERRRGNLDAESEAIRMRLHALEERRRAAMDSKIDALRTRVQALDTSLRLLEPRIRPDVGGVVSRHHPAYGERGALKEFVAATIGESDAGVSAREVGLRAVGHFGIAFEAKCEFHNYMANTIRPALKDLRRAGRVISSPGAGGEMLWHPKRGLPTLAELALLSGSAPSPQGATDDNPDEA